MPPCCGLLFSDRTVVDVDLSAERWTGVLEPLNYPAFPAQVTVDTESGTVTWPGGTDLAPEPLYEQPHAHPLVAARPCLGQLPLSATRATQLDKIHNNVQTMTGPSRG